ncbi:uncharacterized protein EI90DRAFT_3019733 [Cantharellus anzutake]|uniref:uncharacterized protein n=1 Tax=Cantharellus anzutake TaxID=1750568 RepID=UPI0019054340|nr:uncharacterized protein EI90DRAFT_3019733 [Cantharellus anzutake]KAF8324165.1 hypothetical protein EI90DRAFT_3019733 [Cantharellus anzutake]
MSALADSPPTMRSPSYQDTPRRPVSPSNKRHLTILPRSLSSNSLVSVGAVSPTNVTAMDRLSWTRPSPELDAFDNASNRDMCSASASSLSLHLTSEGLQYCVDPDDLPFAASDGLSLNDGFSAIPCTMGVRSRIDLLSLMAEEDELFALPPLESPSLQESYYSSSSTWYNEHFEIDPRTSPRQPTESWTSQFVDALPIYQGSPHSVISSVPYDNPNDDQHELPRSPSVLSLLDAEFHVGDRSDGQSPQFFRGLGEEDDYLDAIEPLSAAAEMFFEYPEYPLPTEESYPSSPLPSPLSPLAPSDAIADVDDTDVNITVAFSANDLVGTHPVSTSRISSARNMSIRTQTRVEDRTAESEKSAIRTFSQKLSQLLRGKMIASGLGARSSKRRDRATTLTSLRCCDSPNLAIQTATAPSGQLVVRRKYTLSIEVEVDVPTKPSSTTISIEEGDCHDTPPFSPLPPIPASPLLPPQPLTSESMPTRESVDTTRTSGTMVHFIDGCKAKSDGPLEKFFRRMKRRTWSGQGSSLNASVSASMAMGRDENGRGRGASLALDEMTETEMEELRRQMRRYST